MIRLTEHFRSLFLLAILLPAFILPYAVHAQESSNDLRTVIQNELLSDPRTSGLSQAQINAMVDVLVGEAQKDGLTSGDITWRPQDAGTFTPQNSVPSEMATTTVECDSPAPLCLFTEAFGFVGPDTTIPFTLGASSMGLVWIFAEMLHRRSRRVL